MDVTDVVGIVFGGVILISPFLLGFGLWQHPPKNINSIYGYRTGISSKNQETWDYSQKLAGKAMMVGSLISVIIFAIILVINPGFLDDVKIWGRSGLGRLFLGLALTLLALFVAIVVVQVKAKRFWKNTL